MSWVQLRQVDARQEVSDRRGRGLGGSVQASRPRTAPGRGGLGGPDAAEPGVGQRGARCITEGGRFSPEPSPHMHVHTYL